MKRLAFVLALTVSSTALAQYAPPPPNYYPPPQLGPPVRYVEQRRWQLFEIGCGIFGGAYVGTVYSALSSNRFEGTIPVAGPFMLMDSGYSAGTNVLFALDGAAQVAGVTLAVLGLVLTKKVPVYAVVPTASGVAIAGRF